MANIYVYQGTPPNLAGTPYQGYRLVSVDNINNPYTLSGGVRVGDGDNIVIGSNVAKNVTFNPAGGTSDSFRLNVTVVDNSNSFDITVTNAAGLAYANPDMTVNVVGDAARVHIALGNNSNNLTVNVSDGASIGNIQADSTNGNNILTVNVGENGTVGNIAGGTDGNDQVILTAANGATIGNVSSGLNGYVPVPAPGFYTDQGGADSIILGDNVKIGDLELLGGADYIKSGSGTTFGTITTGTGDDTLDIGEGATINGYIATGHDL